MSKKKKDDALNELEKMLTDDVRNETDIEGLSISNKELIGAAIRVSVSMILILILYLTGIFDRPIFVSFGILVIVSVEIYRYLKLKKIKKDNLRQRR